MGERLKLPQEGQEQFLVLFKSPTSSVAKVPQAAWKIFKCQPLQASSTVREEITASEVPGLGVLGGLCGHWEASSWPLTHITGINISMATSQPEPHESSVQPAHTCIGKTKPLTQKTGVFHTTFTCKHVGNPSQWPIPRWTRPVPQHHSPPHRASLTLPELSLMLLSLLIFTKESVY